MLFPMVSFFAEVKIFQFCPKTMDYSQAFCPKLSSFFVVLLLLTGRCCEAVIYTILLLLRCSFRRHPFLALFCLSVCVCVCVCVQWSEGAAARSGGHAGLGRGGHSTPHLHQRETHTSVSVCANSPPSLPSLPSLPPPSAFCSSQPDTACVPTNCSHFHRPPSGEHMRHHHTV